MASSSQNRGVRAASRTLMPPCWAAVVFCSMRRGSARMRNGSSTTWAMPSQTKTQRQPISACTAVSAAIMTSWPRHMPEITAELAKPVRPGKARVTITPTGASEAMPLPTANTTP